MAETSVELSVTEDNHRMEDFPSSKDKCSLAKKSLTAHFDGLDDDVSLEELNTHYSVLLEHLRSNESSTVLMQTIESICMYIHHFDVSLQLTAVDALLQTFLSVTTEIKLQILEYFIDLCEKVSQNECYTKVFSSLLRVFSTEEICKELRETLTSTFSSLALSHPLEAIQQILVVLSQQETSDVLVDLLSSWVQLEKGLKRNAEEAMELYKPLYSYLKETPWINTSAIQRNGEVAINEEEDELTPSSPPPVIPCLQTLMDIWNLAAESLVEAWLKTAATVEGETKALERTTEEHAEEQHFLDSLVMEDDSDEEGAIEEEEIPFERIPDVQEPSPMLEFLHLAPSIDVDRLKEFLEKRFGEIHRLEHGVERPLQITFGSLASATAAKQHMDGCRIRNRVLQVIYGKRFLFPFRVPLGGGVGGGGVPLGQTVLRALPPPYPAALSTPPTTGTLLPGGPPPSGLHPREGSFRPPLHGLSLHPPHPPLGGVAEGGLALPPRGPLPYPTGAVPPSHGLPPLAPHPGTVHHFPHPPPHGLGPPSSQFSHLPPPGAPPPPPSSRGHLLPLHMSSPAGAPSHPLRPSWPPPGTLATVPPGGGSSSSTTGTTPASSPLFTTSAALGEGTDEGAPSNATTTVTHASPTSQSPALGAHASPGTSPPGIPLERHPPAPPPPYPMNSLFSTTPTSLPYAAAGGPLPPGYMQPPMQQKNKVILRPNTSNLYPMGSPFGAINESIPSTVSPFATLDGMLPVVKSTDGKMHREKIAFAHRQEQPVSHWSVHQTIDEQMEDYRCLMKRFIFTNRYLLLSHLPPALQRLHALRQWVEHHFEDGEIEIEMLTNSEEQRVAHLTFKTKSSASKAYKKMEANTEGIQVEHAPPRKANTCLWLGNVREFMCMHPLGEELKNIFESFGPIVRWKLMSGKNCGFVVYQNMEDAIRARNHLYGLLFGREICLNIDFSPNDASADFPSHRRYRSVSPHSHRGGVFSNSFRTRGGEGASPSFRSRLNRKEGDALSDAHSPPGSPRRRPRDRQRGGAPASQRSKGGGAAALCTSLSQANKEQRSQQVEALCSNLIANDPVKEALLELLANPDVLALAKERFLSGLPEGRSAAHPSPSRGNRRSPSGGGRHHRPFHYRRGASRSRSPSSPSRGGRRGEGRTRKPVGGWPSTTKPLKSGVRNEKSGEDAVLTAESGRWEGGLGTQGSREEGEPDKRVGALDDGGRTHALVGTNSGGGSPHASFKERRLRSPPPLAPSTGREGTAALGKKREMERAEEAPSLSPPPLAGERAKRSRMAAKDVSTLPSTPLLSTHERAAIPAAVSRAPSELLMLCKVSKQGQLMCNMSAKYVKGCSDMKPSESLNLGQRTHIDRLCSQLRKTQRFSLWQLGADTREDSRHYDELCDYFINKDRVGLLEFDTQDVYLVPPNHKYIQPLNLPDANFMYAFVVEKNE